MTGTATIQPTCKVEEDTRAKTEHTTVDGPGSATGATEQPNDATTDGAAAPSVQQPKAANVVGPPRVFTGAVGRCLHVIPMFRVSISSYPFCLGEFSAVQVSRSRLLPGCVLCGSSCVFPVCLGEFLGGPSWRVDAL